MVFVFPDIPKVELLKPGVKPRLFISYSRAYIALVGDIVAQLDKLSYDVWFDKRDIPGGEDWKRQIAKGIQNAERVLFMMSPEACDSEVCHGEIHHALKHGIHIIPIRINSKTPDDALKKVGLDDRQYIDWGETSIKRNLERLLGDRAMVAPPLPRDIKRQNLKYEQSHRRYLNTFFRPDFCNIPLPDIAEDTPVRGVPLTSVYVPLQVDMSVTIQVDETDRQTIKDWWVMTERSETRADDNIPEEMRERKLREWPALGVGESDLRLLLTDVERKLAERSIDTDNFEPEQNWFMEAHDAANVQSRMVLTGIPGSGKSTFLKHLAMCLAGDQLEDKEGVNRETLGFWLLPTYTPVFIRLADIVRQEFPKQEDVADTEDFDNFLKKALKARDLTPYWKLLQEQLYDGSAIILLDGLDEIPNAVEGWRRDQMMNFISAIVNEYGKCRVIITSRPYAYDGTWRLDKFGQTTLVPLGAHRIFELAQALFKQIGRIHDPQAEAEVFMRALKWEQRGTFWSNPLQFTMGAELWVRNAGKPAEERIPPSESRLYDESVKLMLERWVKRDPVTGKSVADLLGVTPQQLREALEQVALHMQFSYGSDRKATFNQWILIEKLEDCVRRATKNKVPALDYVVALDTLEQRAGLLASEEARLYRFQHLSYQEYLAACELSKSANFPHRVIEYVLTQPGRWRNVLPLLRDIAYSSGVSQLVELMGAYLPTGNLSTLASEHPVWEIVMEAARIYQSQPSETFSEELRTRLRNHLINLVACGALAPNERAEMGRILGELGDTRKGVGLGADNLPEFDWVDIPVGEFLCGDERESDNPPSKLTLPAFKISRYPVTYKQFQAFIDAPDGFHDPRWWDGLKASDEYKSAPGDQRFKFWNHPRENVSWYDAIAFCRWLSFKSTGRVYALNEVDQWPVRLPTEFEWERAARGKDGREYPYEGEFDATKGNTRETGIGQTSAVGMFPDGASPDGVLDMSGNVWQWCLTDYSNPAPDAAGEDLHSDIRRVVRGGSWDGYRDPARAAFRYWYDPSNRNLDIGFRVVLLFPLSHGH